MINETVLELIDASPVKVNGVKVDVECPNCGHKWGLYLTEQGKLPHRWDYCIKCAEARRSKALKELGFA